MLPKIILPPKPNRIKDIEDVKKWIEAWNEFFERTYKQIYAQFEEFDKVSVKGNDGTEIHGFFSQKSDINI